MDRPQVAARVAKVKRELSENEDAFSTVRSDGVSILRDDELIDETSGQQAFAQVVKYLDAFNLNAPLDVNEFRKGSTLWGPNLVRPSARTAMSPWIMGGDPCIEQTRIPTIGVYELSRERGLDEGAIADLYSIEPGAVSDALSLENRLHQAA
jgi:uncharacterized protein (DUF433 family)